MKTSDIIPIIARLETQIFPNWKVFQSRFFIVEV